MRARWIVIVVTAIVGGLSGLAISLLTTPSYQATVQFYVTITGNEGAAGTAYQQSLGAQQRVQSYAALVDSVEIVRQVIDRTGVNLSEDQIVSATTASAAANTALLNVSVADSEPRRALAVASGFGEVLPVAISRLETPEGGGAAQTKLTVVNPPTLPYAPVAPKTEQNIGIGAALGLLAGIGMVLLASALDRRVKSKVEIEAVTGKPVVGSIPFRSKEDKQPDNPHIVPFREGHSPAAEAFRRLRTNLQFLNVDNPPKVLVVTSSVASEGKSETAVNLALALAESGNSVLLIEADLRRPRVVNYMSMSNKVGLTNILSGQAEFSDVVQHTRHSEVDLLACGPLPPNPSELLASDVAKTLIRDLADRYDYVIIDSPPLLPVTDGALLAGLTDGALLVIRANRTTREQVSQAVDNLAKADAKILGAVMVANTPAKRGSAEYYDSYYYSARAGQ
jgi:receptor protein-tyrosine kinase